MTTTVEFLSRLRARDIYLRAADGRLECNAPKGALTGVLRGELAQRKQELLSLLEENGAAAAEKTISGTPRDAEIPLSFAQQRLWFLDRLQPGSWLYNEPITLSLDGPLRRGDLERGLNRIVARHEILRTVFREVDSRPRQEISPALHVPLGLLDLSPLTDADKERAARCQVRELSRLPFDLERGPLIRALLLRFRDQSHWLAVTLHHIVCDGWSTGVLARELAEFYRASSSQNGAGSPLPELPIQYADFAAWQRQWLRGPVLERQLDYWRRQLRAAPPYLDLPTDRPRPSVASYRGARYPVALSPTLTATLRRLARGQGKTLYSVLMGAYQALLARYARVSDLVIGAYVANRNRIEVEPLIGFFVNALMIRNQVSDSVSFHQLLQEVHERVTEASSHQDLPFERLVEELQPVRDTSRTPLFQVCFVLQNFPLKLQLPGLVAKQVLQDMGTSKFDLTLELIETPEGIRGAIEYSDDLFDATTVARLGGYLRGILSQVADNPHRRLGELRLANAAERQQLVLEWNDTVVGTQASPASVIGLFERRAMHSPERVAVVFEDIALTYRELDRYSARMARRLSARGLGPGALAALFLERSPRLLLAVLSVLRTGAAYVPLDPAYPHQRLEAMLQDARPEMVLSEEALADALPRHSGTTVCWSALASSGDELDADGETGLVSPPMPDELAYVLFTSGSTGRPKGVQISHRSLVSFLRSMARQPELTATDRLLAVTSLSFDIAGLELFLPLIVGATLEIVPRSIASDGPALVDRLRDRAITVMQATPATWKLIIEAGWQGDRPLKVLSGGEALTPALARRLVDRSADVWNVFGPTETTIWSTLQRIGRGHRGPVSIGRPIANTAVHLLDRELEPAPLGQPAELFIGGTGLARGYLGRAPETALRFVPNALAVTPGERLYRSGDLARQRSNGRLEFLGRLDHQVKIRGFRIELGEIEAVLASHSGVRECVAIAWPGAADEPRLVAYLTPVAAAAPAVPELLRCAREKLPDYMVPTDFIAVAEWPLTPNGKIDRRSLPDPGVARAAAPSESMPRTESEKVIAEIWRDVLGREDFGVYDNFFDFGGHSLLLLQVHRRLGRAFSKEIVLTQMFKYPTIFALSEYLTAEHAGGRSFAKGQQRAAKKRAARQRQNQRARKRPGLR